MEQEKDILETVTPGWIASQMQAFNLSPDDVITVLGLSDKSHFSKIINGRTNISRPTKAAFYWYFRAISADSEKK